MEALELLLSNNTSEVSQNRLRMFFRAIHLLKTAKMRFDSWLDKSRVRKVEKKYGDKSLVTYEYEDYDKKGNVIKRWTEKSPELPWCERRKRKACLAEMIDGIFYPYSACARIILPEGISEIPEDAFMSYTNKEMYDPHDQLRAGYESKMKNYRLLREIVLPESLIVISNYAFAGCENLIKINFPSRLTDIRIGAFQDCKSLQSVDLQSNINDISIFAFQGCISLKSISIPEKIKVIGWGTFRGCTSLQTVTIPNSVTEFQEEAFHRCKINSFNIPQGTTIIGKNAFSLSGLKAISIPGSVENIGDFAFYECGGLESVSINEGTKRIFIRAFFCTDIKEVIIPESVIAIGKDAFAMCNNLRRMVIKGSQTEIYDQGIAPYRKIKIIVPTGTRDFYCDMLKKTQLLYGFVPPVFEEQDVLAEVNSEQ